MAVADFCWKTYWNKRASEADPITVSGRSGITLGDFSLILSNVREKLDLSHKDVLLDMG